MICRRTRLFIDGSVQSALLWRIVMYWCFCLLAVALMAACWIVLTDTPPSSRELFRRIWLQCGPALLASLLVLPVAVLDCLRLTNRFIGPILRAQTVLQRMSDGEPVQPLSFRKDDFWSDFAEQFNAALAARTSQGELEHLTGA